MEELSPSHQHTSITEQSMCLTSFYRIIMPSVLREHRLALPKKFVEEYGEELSRTIRLELPVGDIWRIRLRKSGCQLWLQDGFEKFMKHFSVDFGYFLLFKYKGNSEFDLHLFDLTATEIDYEVVGSNSESFRKCLATDHVESVSDVFVDQYLKHEAFAESPPRKKRKAIQNLKPFSEIEVVSNQVQGRARALQEAKMYKTDNPSCLLQLKESHARLLRLPTKFCREHDREYAEVIELRDSADRKWRVSCSNYEVRWSLGKGWSQFFEDKRLQEGDVCVFEILSKGILKVSISHAK